MKSILEGVTRSLPAAGALRRVQVRQCARCTHRRSRSCEAAVQLRTRDAIDFLPRATDAFAAFIPFAFAAVMFPGRALRYIGYLVLVLIPLLWSGTVFDIETSHHFYQTISLVIFLVVAFGLNGRTWSHLPKKSFVRAFDVESAQLTTRT